MRRYNLAIVGIGMVGREMVKVLRERNFPVGELRIFARHPRQVEIEGEVYQVRTIEEKSFEDIDIALFAGTEGEKGAAVAFSRQAIESGAVVIDNGADFRLRPDVPLVVPEVNPQAIKEHKGLIANPNCTTIQMVVALAEIYKRFALKQIVLVSFQSASGAGRGLLEQMQQEIRRISKSEHLSLIPQKRDNLRTQLSFNIIAQIGSFKEEDYTTEEWKTVRETQKIFADRSIKITSTCVRVPVFISHSEAIYFQTRKKAGLEEIKQALQASKGVVFRENPEDFPFPLEAQGRDEVFVGRVRRDIFNENSFWLWSVADNLRKGAALNAIQIAELVCATLN
ncbi:MAG: aspartate-semialdehyde dehydrogenase [Candidatus Omnitrophota bacterium]|nr:MAG: aspartate-semialdehyde dehydrogenase [Candidatus Omnitrophota bacterium]